MRLFEIMIFAMQLTDFDYDLPPELIANEPLAERSASRLLTLDASSGELQHRQFRDLVDLLTVDDLLVFNNTQVIPARVRGQKTTGAQVEVMLERILDKQRIVAMMRSSKAAKPGTELVMPGNTQARVLGRRDDLFEIEFAVDDVLSWFEQYGEMPLPPYIERPVTDADKQRYQTVYAREPGAVAAPTAGLHFDDALLAALDKKGIQRAELTLHVGAGTFQPVRCDDITQHHMHSEYIVVPEELVAAVQAAKARGGRVIAVGTTVVRALESASQSGQLQPMQGETDIFIYPGYQFRCIDAMVTNFHLPCSSLLMLVAAFAGYDEIMTAYQAAIAGRYRFFSYGDAMLIQGVC